MVHQEERRKRGGREEEESIARIIVKKRGTKASNGIALKKNTTFSLQNRGFL